MSSASMLNMESSHPVAQCLLQVSLPETETEQQFPSSAKFNNMWNYISISPTPPCVAVKQGNAIFYKLLEIK